VSTFFLLVQKTHAYHKMEDTVPQEVKYSRLQEIHRVYRECLLAANELFVGTTQLVLLEKVSFQPV